MNHRHFRFEAPSYWLTHVHVPTALLVDPTIAPADSREGLSRVNLHIEAGTVTQIVPASTAIPDTDEALDLRWGLVFPCFVDLHTHLDKGHIWRRAPNMDGSFDTALTTVDRDRQAHWHEEDVYRRMEFGLKCSYAHGTIALRTHIDALNEQAAISFGAFKTLQQEWRDRLILQAACLVPLDYYLTPEGEKLADLVAEVGGILGGVTFMCKELDQQLDRLFELAKERHLSLDLHTDESGNPDDVSLRHVAEAALRHEFQEQIVCGHCCSLAVQAPNDVLKTIEAVKQAQIGIVSLPMCNLYLQDRNQQSSSRFYSGLPDASVANLLAFPTHTPRWRGVTLLHELNHAGVAVAVASDNCRDPFYGYGDHDGLEVLTQATRIAQLDAPYDQWSRTVSMTPANLMGLPTIGRIGVGLPADLLLFRARYFSELFARPQSDRTVLRHGQPIDTTLPDYEELDDLL